MESFKTVQDYIESYSERKKELTLLRDILLETELKEEMKWGAPCYTLNGKNVVGLAAFKSYVGLWFHQGVFLKDKAQVLINAQEGTTKALRQWRFQEVSEIDSELLTTYIKEAIQNQKEGKVMKPEPKKLAMPIELKNALDSDTQLKDSFEQLTPGKQKEYAEHIGSAKQESTRLSRLDKAVSLILSGVGLHDKYK